MDITVIMPLQYQYRYLQSSVIASCVHIPTNENLIGDRGWDCGEKENPALLILDWFSHRIWQPQMGLIFSDWIVITWTKKKKHILSNIFIILMSITYAWTHQPQIWDIGRSCLWNISNISYIWNIVHTTLTQGTLLLSIRCYVAGCVLLWCLVYPRCPSFLCPSAKWHHLLLGALLMWTFQEKAEWLISPWQRL